MKVKFLPGLTTTSGSDWRAKIKEIDELGLKEIALFPTCLDIKERKELYNLLEKTKLKKILHVHLRDDMEEWELEYFKKKYLTDVFNIHPNNKTLEFVKKSKFKDDIYIENLMKLDADYFTILEKSAGLCIDFTHLEDQGRIQKNTGYEKMDDLLKKYPIGCCHISAISKVPFEETDYLTGKKFLCRDCHWIERLSDLDYVKRYKKLLPKYASIELENSFKEQLKAKKYLEKICRR